MAFAKKNLCISLEFTTGNLVKNTFRAWRVVTLKHAATMKFASAFEKVLGNHPCWHEEEGWAKHMLKKKSLHRMYEQYTCQKEELAHETAVHLQAPQILQGASDRSLRSVLTDIWNRQQMSVAFLRIQHSVGFIGDAELTSADANEWVFEKIIKLCKSYLNFWQENIIFSVEMSFRSQFSIVFVIFCATKGSRQVATRHDSVPARRSLVPPRYG